MHGKIKSRTKTPCIICAATHRIAYFMLPLYPPLRLSENSNPKNTIPILWDIAPQSGVHSSKMHLKSWVKWAIFSTPRVFYGVFGQSALSLHRNKFAVTAVVGLCISFISHENIVAIIVHSTNLITNSYSVFVISKYFLSFYKRTYPFATLLHSSRS